MPRLRTNSRKVYHIVIFFLLTLNSYLILELYQQKWSNQQIVEIKSIENKSQKNDNFNQSLLSDFSTYTWMLNNRVYQYSVHLLIKNGKLRQIDGIIATRGEFNDIAVKQAFVCVIKSIKNEKKLKIKVSSAFHFVGNTKRIKCDINEEMFNLEEIRVAIIIVGIITCIASIIRVR